MTCQEAEPLLHASLDGELDPAGAVEVERHLAGCADCSARVEKLVRLREEIAAADLDWGAGADLRRLRASILRKQQSRRWWPAAAMAAAAAAIVAALLIPRPASVVERQLVDNHVRSLMADHLVDVPSSDHHTVKPWFQGKLDFSPPVPDLTAQGFELAGGRLDVVGGRKVAALVYKRRAHVINLWIEPGGGGSAATTIDGYQVLEWSSGGMTFWTVSDLNPAELQQFRDLIRAHQ